MDFEYPYIQFLYFEYSEDFLNIILSIYAILQLILKLSLKITNKQRFSLKFTGITLDNNILLKIHDV